MTEIAHIVVLVALAVGIVLATAVFAVLLSMTPSWKEHQADRSRQILLRAGVTEAEIAELARLGSGEVARYPP